MIIAYLMPNEAAEPRDGLGFVAAANTEDEAVAKLRARLEAAYSEEDEVEWHFDWHIGNPEERPHVIVFSGSEQAEFYWLHTAEG